MPRLVLVYGTSYKKCREAASKYSLEHSGEYILTVELKDCSDLFEQSKFIFARDGLYTGYTVILIATDITRRSRLAIQNKLSYYGNTAIVVNKPYDIPRKNENWKEVIVI